MTVSDPKLKNKIPGQDLPITEQTPIARPQRTDQGVATPGDNKGINPDGLSELVGKTRQGFRGVFNPDLTISIRGLPKGLSVGEVLGRLEEHDPSDKLLQAALDFLHAP